jgi:hypothetical protein
MDNNYNTRSYLDTEVNGTWHDATDVRGVAAGAAEVQISGLSCAANGNCVAIGTYTTAAQELQFFQGGTPFLDAEIAGVWQPAVIPPGLASLDAGFRYTSGLDAVSCASAGNCAAAGTYYSNGTYPSFVMKETNGKWSNAAELSGLKSLGLSSTGPVEAPVDALSCVLPGDCILGGYLSSGTLGGEGYVAQEVNGHWGPAELVPGLEQLNAGASALVGAVSCSSTGNCSVGGTYADSNSAPQAFVASEVHGAWSSAIEVPGTAALNTGGGELPSGGGPPFGAEVQTIECLAGGDCTIVGWYQTLAGASDLFVDSESGGVWATAIAMPNLATLNAGASLENIGAAAAGLACASVGNCVIAGNYVDASGNAQLFTETQTSGTFEPATELPGSGTVNAGFPDAFADTVNSLSCSGAGACELAGSDAAGGFVDAESGGSWATTPSAFVTSPTVYLGTNAHADEISCPKAGSCAVIGSYETASRTEDVFYAQETSGVWGADATMSGLESLAPGGGLSVDSFQCSAVGVCTIFGTYLGSGGVDQLFYDVERNGVWQPPQTVTGLPAVTKGPLPYFFYGPRWTGMSCGNAANCVGVGLDTTSSTTTTPFMVTEVKGAWTVDLSEPGSTLPGSPELTDVSCPLPGDCVAMGRHLAAGNAQQVFTVSEVNGTWGAAELLPSPTSLSTATGPLKAAYVEGLTCRTEDTCAVTGQVNLKNQSSEPFVMSRDGGSWEPATLLPGFSTLAKVVPAEGFPYIGVTSPTCPTPTACTIVGTYPIDFQQGFFSTLSSFVLVSKNGVWSPLVLLKNPATTKTKHSTSTYAFDVSGLACLGTRTCFAIGVTQQTKETQLDANDWLYTYSYAVASATGSGSSYGAPVDLTPRISTYNGAPWNLFDISCGTTGQVGACGAGGSYDDITATLPFVMTAP